MKIAILDDYQQIALQTADWEKIKTQAEITVYSDTIADPDELIKRLSPYDIICVMRERTPLSGSLLKKLPNLKLIVSTGTRNASIDTAAAAELKIEVRNTGYVWTGAPELSWALLMAIARNIPQEYNNIKAGKWQTTVGTDLSGKTLGIIGLGNIGSKMAAYANVFGMKVIAWSENLTAEKAQAAGAHLAPDKATIFKEADFITLHLPLSDRSRGIVGKYELNLMQPTAYIINTSRGPLIDEKALIKILQEKKIAGAALDVYNEEPLPLDHPFRSMSNVLTTGHIGFVTADTYKLFYEDTVKHIEDWLKSN